MYYFKVLCIKLLLHYVRMAEENYFATIWRQFRRKIQSCVVYTLSYRHCTRHRSVKYYYLSDPQHLSKLDTLQSCTHKRFIDLCQFEQSYFIRNIFYASLHSNFQYGFQGSLHIYFLVIFSQYVRMYCFFITYVPCCRRIYRLKFVQLQLPF